MDESVDSLIESLSRIEAVMVTQHEAHTRMAEIATALVHALTSVTAAISEDILVVHPEVREALQQACDIVAMSREVLEAARG